MVSHQDLLKQSAGTPTLFFGTEHQLNLSPHTHTHQFNGPLSGTTRVSQYQKGKTNLDFTEARDSEWQWLQLGHMQVCTLLQTDTTPAPHRSVFYRPDALPAAQNVKSLHFECKIKQHYLNCQQKLKFMKIASLTVEVPSRQQWMVHILSCNRKHSSRVSK